jgi:Sulfotransferase domain
MKISMWSGPRNLSTALMYAFAARGDCDVWDEPFYAAYLKATGIDHPMRDTIIQSHDSDATRVSARLAAPAPRHLYAKQMTLHMIDGFPRDWMQGHTNIFLIRDTVRVVASYAAKRENPTLDDLGFRQQAELFDEVADWLGEAPPVVDSDDIRRAPEATLTKLCAQIGLPYTDKMLTWPKGPKPFDGIWASHWYGAVHRSTGFDAPDNQPIDLPPDLARLADQARPFHDRLLAHVL